MVRMKKFFNRQGREGRQGKTQCLNKKTFAPSASFAVNALDFVLFSICAKDVVGAWFARGYGAYDARDVEEMLVVQVCREAVAAPGPAAHRQGERQPVVEAAAGRERMGLLDDDAAYRHFEAEAADMRVVLAVNAARMAVAHVRVDVAERVER